MDIAPFAPLEPGTYYIDPDHDPSTPLLVVPRSARKDLAESRAILDSIRIEP